MLIPRVMIAGTNSGVGKTTLATGIMSALVHRGCRVQGFKVGPDYIDPGYHAAATQRKPRNLDVWLLGQDRLVPQFVQGIKEADIAVVEGVMGLFDGIWGTKGTGSSAHIARLLQLPVVLVIDVRGQARSAAALVHGFASFDPQINLAGVIINRTSNSTHYQGIKAAVEEEAGIPVLGTMPLKQELNVAERHLGLVPAVERSSRGGDNPAYLEQLGQLISEHLDLDRLIALAESAPTLGIEILSSQYTPMFNVTIAVARDEAFHFYYQDSLEILENLGAKIVEFSPLHDQALPANADGLYIGGGFPEEFVSELTQNHQMMESIRRFNHEQKPIYAECGGLMYLCQQIIDRQGQIFAGVGLIPAVNKMTERLAGLGYRQGRLLRPTVLGEMDLVVHGHEFHYSTIEYLEPAPAYQLRTAGGEERGVEGYSEGNLFASYLHLNLAGHPELAVNFVKKCAQAAQ